MPSLRALSPKKLLILAIVIVGLAILAAAASYFLNQRTSADKTPPEIRLTSPTSEEWYATDQDKVTVEGLAVDESGIESITWESNDGQSGSSTVSDDSWSIENINLSNGDNKITIKAADTKGNSAEIVLNVVYNADILFYDLTLSQDFIYKDDPPEQITARAGVETKSSEGIGAVNLYKVVGEQNEKLTEMLDNGVVANGDDIPGDNVFSGIESFSSNTQETILLRVGASLKGKEEISYSGVINLTVLVKPTQDQISKVFSLNDEIENKFEEIKKSKSGNEAAKELVDFLSEKEEIETAGVSEGDGNGVWWKFKETGILGGVQNNPEGTRADADEAKERKRQAQAQDQTLGITETLPTPVRFGPSVAHAQPPKLEVKSTKAIYLGPYLHQFQNTDDYHDAWQTIKNSKCPKCQTTEKKDAAVTVEDFKTLSNYGLIVIVSHGDTWFNGVFGSSRGQVITYTYQQITAADYQKYLPDLQMNRLALGGSNTLIVLPSFISRYNGTFPNSLVYIGTCRSTYNFSMASAYLSKGAKAYYGFSGYVLSNYAKEVAGEMMKSFLDKGKTASESFIDATNAKGASDGAGAFFNFWGWIHLEMGGKKVQNEGFEEGLVGWQAEGDSRVINRLASLKPQEGSKMAIISTGLGSVNNSNSAVIQTVCSLEGKLTVSFKYNVVSEEPLEWVNTAYDDNFTMTVSINGKKTVLVRRTINNSSWKKISGIDFAGGDNTTFHTGWKSISKNLGQIKKDDTVKIEFRVSDKGDSIYDTAALLDSIKLEVN